jgi:phosphatidylserine/phosphatidylglycerophosphate/cardiolipin synthase-like enzyme
LEAKSEPSIYLLPQDNNKALNKILKNIDSSKNSIKITIYNFTHKKIAKRLKKAASRGVKIQIIYDENSSKNKNGRTTLYYLAKYKNISIYRLKGKKFKKKRKHKNSYGHMHIKAAVIDSKIVIFGSANWSYSAFSKNYEILFIQKDYLIAKKFDNFFEILKKESTLYQ